MLTADREREQAELNRDGESSSRGMVAAEVAEVGHLLAEVRVRQMAAAIGASAHSEAVVAAASASMAASTAAIARRQQRAHTAQVLLGGASSSPPPHSVPASASGQAQLSRPSSQPQSHAQSSTSSSGQLRPQSTGCQQQRPQAPSTALPPLRPGHSPPRPAQQTPPMPAEPSGSRGGSPLMVPPLSYRSGPHIGRLPGQPPMSASHALLEGTSSQSSSNSGAHRFEADESISPVRVSKRSNSTKGEFAF